MAATDHRVAASAEMPTTGKMPAATTAGAVLGISQSWRTRYRNAEQQGSDDPNNMPRSVHKFTPFKGPGSLL
jgi:hypothetical protein